MNRHTEHGTNSQGNSIFAPVENMNWLQALRNLYQTGTIVEGNNSESEIVVKPHYAQAVGYTAFGAAVNYAKFVLKEIWTVVPDDGVSRRVSSDQFRCTCESDHMRI